MKSKKFKDSGLYFITDSKLTKSTVIDDVKAAIKAGAKNIAIISGIVTKDNVGGTVRKFINMMNSYK
jgi:hypothetical protein